MANTLVIVESPTKARTIRGFLPRTFRVEASMGHVRDLPNNASEIPASHKAEKWAKTGVNTENNFEPLYVVPKDKKKIVKELKDALKSADELLLATDEDREGESISWHLLQLLNPKVPVKRMVFHEITEDAIKRALSQTRELNMELVHAQETRRILDRLVGYTVSPLLWKKVAWGLSAGRVQSVAVRLLVQRERARRAFRSGSYWDLKAQLEHAGITFEAKLNQLKGERIATGADFDENTGEIKAGTKVRLLSEADAQGLLQAIDGKTWSVAEVEEKPTTRRPAPPFTTSTLQQEANRKLRLSAREAMRTAQGLYERGYITYMRTDSVHLSEQAITASRSCVEEKYGADHLSPQPRQYTTKSRNAQEAHEAIRPAGASFRTPAETGLKGLDLSLYELIWKRTVASQMADARLTMVSAQIDVEDARFRASGKRIDFAGFFRAYVEGSDDPDAALEGKEVLLPPLRSGDHPVSKGCEALGHQTQPPARYSEAALVKMLEKEGIGRPSTYASTLQTLRDREYVELEKKQLVPQDKGRIVTAFLESFFDRYIEYDFTASLEEQLDKISAGELSWLDVLRAFWKDFSGAVDEIKDLRVSQVIDSLNDLLAPHIFPDKGDGTDPRACPSCSDGRLSLKVSRFGAFIGCSNYPECNYTRQLAKSGDGEEEAAEGPKILGQDPETGLDVSLRNGRFGPYVQLGEEAKPKRASLPKGWSAPDMDLDKALQLLSLPREVGPHPEDGKMISAGIGRYGPFVLHEGTYANLSSPDEVFSVGINRAVDALAEKRAKGGRGRATPAALKELGEHPEQGGPITVRDGRYGPYVNHGKVNATLPKGTDPMTVTMEQAVELITAKAGKGGAKKKAAPKKAAAKKPAAKKTAAKKTTAKKTTAKAKVDTSSEEVPWDDAS